ncbi:MAG: hypothetical protein K8F91_21120, partial [Candidatus Obscuribacterales bacterium]|nr:hypothetical protein [Candidatus Obscuribacterales bacterium]
KCLEKDPRGRYQAFMPIKDDLLDAAKNSRIYLPSAADSEYESQSYGQKSDNSALASEARIPEPEASPEAEAKTEAKKAEEEIEEPLPPETRQEMEGTIKGLRSHMYTLTGVAIVVLVSLALVMGYEGSSEDHGPLWKKLFWQYQMSTGDNALKKGDFASAESSFTQAQSLADQFQDNEDRKIKSLKGLLALYEAKKDEKEAHAYRQEIVDLDKKRMEMLFSSAETDAESVKDVDLSVPVAEMSESTAQEYSEKFINKAKSYLQKGQVKKAESFLLKALSIEEKAQTKHNQACLECANQLAEESKPGEHLAEITSLLERSVSLSKKGNQKTETRVRTLLNLGLFQARKSQFDKAEASVKQALKLASELGIKDDATVKSVLAAYVELLEKAEENEKAAKYKS